MTPKSELSRRKFISAVPATSFAAAVSQSFPSYGKLGNVSGKLALLGGSTIRTNRANGPKWPYVNDKMVENIVSTTKSCIWSRIQKKGGNVDTFEKEFA